MKFHIFIIKHLTNVVLKACFKILMIDRSKMHLNNKSHYFWTGMNYDIVSPIIDGMFLWPQYTVYPKKYAHGFCFAVLCCGYTLTDFPISIRLTSLALWQSYDCPSASKATLMNMDKYFMLIHYERLHNHNKAKHNKTVCIFLGGYCTTAIDTTRTMLTFGIIILVSWWAIRLGMSDIETMVSVAVS